ncbi:MAG: hypothetical protein E7394_06470 [Ruminococcaceae bacterium]|nr:hypothetical protein [Oscillospiraceae bacterium]
MRFFNKVLYVIMLSSLLISFSTSCSKDKKEVVSEEKKNEAEINAKYDELMKQDEEELLPEDYNPILNNFTTVDFQFTLTDDTLAFNLPENSYTKITPAGASFGFHSQTGPADYFEGNFQTAKGIAVKDGKDALISSYKLSDVNVFTDESGISAFAFATDGNYEYMTLSSSDAKKIYDIYQRSVSSAQNAGENVMAEYGAYTSVALVCVANTPEGEFMQYEMYRFDKIME